jgi:Protein of unknown function (DUF3300)
VNRRATGFFKIYSMSRMRFRRLIAAIACGALLIGTTPAPLRAQDTSPPDTSSTQNYTAEQLDALLAPIALYPDQLLTQILMASVYPLQVVDAYRWLQDPANKALTGDALDNALAAQNWDPSVKSLIPFPQVLTMMNDKLDWMQQLGYAMSEQQSDVMNSIQRLRQQAQAAGQLNTTEQQVVSTEGQTIVIAPAQPNIVYVPSYNPTVVYGAWPYPAYPPVYLPPPPGYVAGTALLNGLAFGAGVAISASLWGWARPNWNSSSVNVNVNRYNSINVNRARINNSNWRPTNARPAGGFRPPPGPVGRPARPTGLPANGIGRPHVSVPGGITRPPAGMGPGNHQPINQNGNARPNAPNAGKPAFNPANRPAQGQINRPSTRPAMGQGGGNRAPGAFSGMGDGRSAAQFGNRGAQSRQFSAPGGGGGFHRGGGGRRR